MITFSAVRACLAGLAVAALLAGCGPVGYAPPVAAAPYQGSTMPPPALDRNGRPNYDANGQYVGGHGIGTLVDDPDRAPPPPRTPSDMVRQEQDKVDRSVCQGLHVGEPDACN